ncbi:MAG: TIGR03936 family radical SAM-associated protein [Lachnospiraceae bacterium]|nr:TIGR03936 family radical SAM-associated protein [Lachnospiraceae bacterium]
MKVRIKFSKHGNTRYIGHLDIMRYFQKAMRRADIPIRYSEGFSPHQIMSFAAPLGVGIESDYEILDIEITEQVDPDTAIRRLNEVMCDGIRVLDWKYIDDNTGNAMSLVASADYFVECDCESLDPLNQPEIIITKESKSGDKKKVDIKPMIYKAELTGDGVFLHIAQGSAGNLKPDIIMSVLNISKYHIIRKCLYDTNGLTL